MKSLGQELAGFVAEIKFEDLPEVVVHEAKRNLLDSIGCALGGVATDKGKISVALARRMGGPPESSIIGVGDKVSCCGAAFANGELINALDYDAILWPPGHVSPYVIPAPLALAESTKASGKDLILAVVLGHELSIRLSRAMTAVMEYVPPGSEKGSVTWSPSYGYNQCIFGATAGVGKILKFDTQKLCHALGIAGYFCPVPSFTKWAVTVPSAMTKYGSTGWESSAAVNAALLAEMGYVGDTTIFDGDYGFWKFFGAEKWEPEAVVEGMGKTWLFLEMNYKPYPCCRIMHGALDCFINVIDRNRLIPDDIESVIAFCYPLVEFPLFGNSKIATQIDAQFSVAYVFAVAAHRVKLEDWQNWETMKRPEILEFMKKVSCQTHPGFWEERQHDPRRRIAKVEVVARGKTFKEETMYVRGTPFTDFKTSDEELVDKFRRNASRILTQSKIDRAVKSILELETVDNIAGLVSQITL